MNRICKLKGVVQPYSWGGTSFLPALLNTANPDAKPFAEYWLGAHPKASAMVPERSSTLSQLIAAQPEEILGETVAAQFGALPYLLKVLDVQQMLSIQVHPSKAAAKEAFAEENRKGIPLDAPHRNYKDDNHKPELMVALSEFWLLHGFKPEQALIGTLEKIPALHFLLPLFHSGGYKALYQAVMTMPQEEVDAVLTPLMQEMIPAYKNGELQKSSEHFWAARAVLSFCKHKHFDRGIFSIYFFNLLHLQPGEGIYQPAGLPHAYLEGQNVEVMAASDNVLRAGLTDKHVDVAELLRHVRFEATEPKIIRANGAVRQHYDAPVDEFALERFSGAAAQQFTPASARVLLVYEGELKAGAGEEELLLKRGEAALLLPKTDVVVTPLNGAAVYFLVSTPVDKN